MCSNGIYPYEYFNNYEKLLETQLPEQNKCYLSLNNSKM